MLAEQLTGPVAFHGEGPVWWPEWDGLRWLDMFAGDVLSLAQDGSVVRRNVGTLVAAMRPRRAGGSVLALERGFALECAGGEISYLGDLWDSPRLRMNEGGCDPDGRFYCGSMAYDQSPAAGSMYRLDAGLTATRLFEGVTISNGLAWNPAGTLAYYTDTPTRRVDVFDYETSTGLTGRRPLVTIPGDAGSPDGLCVDAEGGVWVALYGGAAVHRYSPEGTLEAVLDLPVSRPTACVFGGAGLDTLFVTTSRENLPPDAEPRAGALFVAYPGVTGLAALPFSG